ncbi:hypothetical protein LCGC14_0224170 [marine sediment metagenome]|uniref:Bacteriophage T7 Gp4 DNA primase/helicase N-terminal domain-containing protein n=1 Tax=marine sediment metagenome TaxID=412755 RepID=A0A0F9UGQ6_9ZZZZ
MTETCPKCKKESVKRHLTGGIVECWECDMLSNIEDWYDSKDKD